MADVGGLNGRGIGGSGASLLSRHIVDVVQDQVTIKA